MNDLPVPDDVLEDWLGGPLPKEKLKESTMRYLITYYYKNDLEQRHQRHHSMQMAVAVAGMLIAKGDYVVDSITTEYS